MITLSLLKYLENNNFGKIDTNLFWQKLTLDRIGVYIADLGTTQTRGGRRVQTYELYSRGSSDVDGYKRLQAIIDFLNENFVVCDLPAVKVGSTTITEGFKSVTITPLSSISSNGLDANGRIIYSAVGTIYY